MPPNSILSPPFSRCLAALLFLGAASAPTWGSVDLPDIAPLPTLNRAKPAQGSETSAPPELPEGDEAVPVPGAKPGEPNPRRSAALPGGVENEQSFLPDVRTEDRPTEGTMPAAERACRQHLQQMGAKFENLPAETDPAGCAIPYPLVLESLGTGIALAPEAVMNCRMAEAAVRFVKGVALPAARSEFGKGLKGISQASAYVCRPRNGTRRLSEHAFGNALDIASFTLADGRVVAVEPTPDAKSARFLDSVRDSACGPFKTVLGPGSDADHATHFHLDLRPRRNGSTFCQ
jgi:hypothetical protein